jgi:hypothetical protein
MLCIPTRASRFESQHLAVTFKIGGMQNSNSQNESNIPFCKVGAQVVGGRRETLKPQTFYSNIGFDSKRDIVCDQNEVYAMQWTRTLIMQKYRNPED